MFRILYKLGETVAHEQKLETFLYIIFEYTNK